MRKIVNPSISVILVSVFTFSAVYCCCAMDALKVPLLKAKGMAAMAGCPCHKSSSPEQKSTHHGYCFLQSPTADTVQLSKLAVPSAVSLLHPPEAIVPFAHYVRQFSFVRTAYGGMISPQVLSVPLYLQTHAFRL
ncbi:MAG: hypothetical protein KGK03_06050 [Candidatus Omnitrophica bacterium]|nr:hypothetical protein [Candidatus Omnitrophota bacterium]MDE2222615.1 hypothetical protein [Candidatus Omnitrophota bacterium]